MTEEEAKKKWCPLSMVNEDNNQMCISSHCMAWRVNRDDYTEVSSTGERTYHQTGFCGLAGKE